MKLRWRFPCAGCGTREHAYPACPVRPRRNTRPDVAVKKAREARLLKERERAARKLEKQAKPPRSSRLGHSDGIESCRHDRLAKLCADLRALTEQGAREGRWR